MRSNTSCRPTDAWDGTPFRAQHMGAESAVYDCLVFIVAASNPTTNRLLSNLLADPDELVTEPVIRTSETVDAQIELRLQKVIEMVCTQSLMWR